ncbi:potassium channel subfamily K member 13-like [Solea senegalensis]|uniref:Potassium channel subfamily K member 13-like n=1 Tax=Solea senegalensis TaxID=28829 RepID=A0AAV6PGI1_SOLSE|nr:potassium channel subfamily K member 13 [Solea senegalensis]XP_043871114.1 potassium channel subfamily K member 13 [Solea senegalensis]XP_043871115.1 potassium channel subfamily K member 13 [Solea senegalensis]XP_043871116.1 potassium channel subfamily K member 13 [Solea senegalensis]XP_043871117.1 potassium channel subfamily K member 13 [Solea senegalensis]KAG7464330.1 potassium channel subfamily K member 13-like [Solea senegalensis]
MAQRRAAAASCCCCCSRTPMNEDNARFCLLAGLILLYLLCGAAIFSALEHPFELRARRLWKQQLDNFTQRYRVKLDSLHTLLRQYEEANGAGIRVDTLRPRWDFSGAFYFVGTVVSTIGFGMTTPATIPGKIFLVVYGLIGCAATILFFNLFLERIITMLAYIMRWCHERRLRCGGVMVMSRRDETSGEEDSLEGWKPSVYYVMLILGVASIVIACSASTLYCSMENWSYVDSLYFCFVAFSTIGFGDLVSSQRQQYDSQEAYQLGNCLFILMGVCCIYSLFNVISIVIKQTLNWILAKLICSGQQQPCSCSTAGCWGVCCTCFQHKTHHQRRVPVHLRQKHFKRNTVQPITSHCPAGRHHYTDSSVETVCDSETDAGALADGVYVGQRLSEEMISVSEFMVSNRVSLALLQKQLSETAHQGQQQSYSHQNGFSGGVGALAIMNNRLQETSMDR